MGYYMHNAYGARGGFFSFLGSAIKPILGGLSQAGGKAGEIARQITPMITGHPIVSAVAGAAAASATTAAIAGHHGGAANVMGPGAPMPGGMHISGHLHLGGRGKKASAPAMGGRRSRRMNVCNPRALRRAIRRAHGFQHLALKVLAFSRPHGKPKGHPYFKRARKRTH